MQGYETILVPIDIYSDYELVVEKAIAIAGNSHKIHLLYVAYPQTNVEPYGLFLERDFSILKLPIIFYFLSIFITQKNIN